jgi:hypothetical protein
MGHVDKQEQTFQKILALCDIMERMLQAVEAPGVKNRKQLLEIVTPVAHSVDHAVKVVTETFIEHVNNGEKPDKQRSYAVDAAMKGIYDSLRSMKEKGEQLVETLHKEAK